MTKKRRFPIGMLRPMSPDEMLRMSAESMATDAIRADEHIKAKQKELATELMATTRRVMSGTKPFVKKVKR